MYLRTTNLNLTRIDFSRYKKISGEKLFEISSISRGMII